MYLVTIGTTLHGHYFLQPLSCIIVVKVGDNGQAIPIRQGNGVQQIQVLNYSLHVVAQAMLSVPFSSCILYISRTK